MQALLESLPEILARPLEPASATIFSRHEEIKVEIYRVMDEVERCILQIEREDDNRRQDITRRVAKLIDMLQKLNPFFEGRTTLP
jgi:hypothetical protein